MEDSKMLVLSRKKSDSILIDGGIKVTVLEVRGNVVRLGIEAPKEVSILRTELCEQASTFAAS
jgi:carbon storage regulator